ncbi:MAG TPA: hypothetical protein VG756_22065 [Pseudonocardiaceae bacterium]|nr:hypothetical protein [Pseudonocardiaceae bacterium]
MGREDRTFDRYRALTVRFAPYGLASWTGPRRFDFWQRSADPSRADQIWLGHDDELTSITVGTFDPIDRPADSLDIAEQLTIKLVNLGLPHWELPRAEEFDRRLVDHAFDLAAHRAGWPTVAITVDGRPARLRWQGFAGYWAGVVDGHSLGAYGTGARPDPLTLVRFTDTTPYGFDVTAGVRFVDMTASDWWRPAADWHPDHRPLL